MTQSCTPRTQQAEGLDDSGPRRRVQIVDGPRPSRVSALAEPNLP